MWCTVFILRTFMRSLIVYIKMWRLYHGYDNYECEDMYQVCLLCERYAHSSNQHLPHVKACIFNFHPKVFPGHFIDCSVCHIWLQNFVSTISLRYINTWQEYKTTFGTKLNISELYMMRWLLLRYGWVYLTHNSSEASVILCAQLLITSLLVWYHAMQLLPLLLSSFFTANITFLFIGVPRALKWSSLFWNYGRSSYVKLTYNT